MAENETSTAHDLDGVSPQNRDTINRFREFSASMMGANGQLLALHLLIEATMEDCIQAMLPNPRAVLERDWSFSNKLALMEGLFPRLPRTQAVFAVVKALNGARNAVAHGREQDEIDAVIEKVFATSTTRLDFHEFEDAPRHQRLTAIAIHACGYMLGMVERAVGTKPPSQIGVET